MSLKLITPQLSAKPEPGVETRAVYVEEWVEALPFANPPALLRELHDTLYRLNRSPLKAAQRFGLLELYLPAYRFLLELQDEQGPVHSMAAFDKYRAETDATRHVADEMASGYKLVLAELLEGRTMWRRHRQLATALQRAFMFLCFALVHSHSEYLPTPLGSWDELSDLYRYAEENGLEAQEQPGGKLRPEFAKSIRHHYKRVLLVSLLDPHRLAHAEAWSAYRLLDEWADAAEVTRPQPVEKPTGMFVVDALPDHRPVPYKEVVASTLSDRYRLLNAAPVIRAAQQRLSALRQRRAGTGAAEPGAGERGAGAAASLLNTVVRALSLPRQRGTPRRAGAGQVRVAIGLSTLHHFLSGGDPDPEPASGDTGGGGSTGEESIEIGAPGGAGLGGRHTYSAEFWDLHDVGPGGVGLIKHMRPNVAIAAGDLIGVQPEREHDARTWMIGVVRWLRISGPGEYQAGIQILARSAEPVTLTAGPGESQALHKRAGLALSRLARAPGNSIVAPSGTFARGTPMLVEAPQGALHVAGEVLIESTLAYDRFTYTPAEAQV